MEWKATNKNMVTYQGNGKFISCLLTDENNDYYIFIGKTNGIDIIHEIEKAWFNNIISFKSNEQFKIEIPLYSNNKGNMVTVVKLNNIEEYFTIVKVLETVYE